MIEFYDCPFCNSRILIFDYENTTVCTYCKQQILIEREEDENN
jgi:DNA-directed RNA polymerase subunit RPC12/RpoP